MTGPMLGLLPCLVWICLLSLLNIAKVPAYSIDILSYVLPHMNTMPLTQGSLCEMKYIVVYTTIKRK